MKSSIFAVFVFLGANLGSVAVAFGKGHVTASEEYEGPAIHGSLSTKGFHQADFPKKAKVSAAEAIEAAKKVVPGKVSSVSLEDEDGYLVFAIVIANDDSLLHEVLVDAGNGLVLRNQRNDSHYAEKESEEDDD